MQLDSSSLFVGPRLQFGVSQTLDLRGYIESWDTAIARPHDPVRRRDPSAVGGL